MYYKIPSPQQENLQPYPNPNESYETHYKTDKGKAAYKNPPRLRPNKRDVVARLTLSNRILTAEPIPSSQAVAPSRYQLRVNILVPGQWSRAEIEAVLDITEDWAWRSFLDLRLLKEMEQLLDVAARGVAE